MNRTQRIIAFSLLLMVPAGVASAQVFTPTGPASATLRRLEAELRAKQAEVDPHGVKVMSLPEGERKAAEIRAAEEFAALAARIETEERKSTGAFLTQAGFEGGTASPQIAIDAASLFFKGGKARLYVRSTLPTAAQPSKASAAEATLNASLDDRIKSALNDPYGGLLYLATGTMIRLPQAKPDAPDSGRGLFADFRAGAKFIQLPESAASNSYRAAPFLVASGGLRFSELLWFDPDGTEQAGELQASVAFVLNHVLDSSVSALFSPDDSGRVALRPTTGSLNVSIGLAITGSIGLTVNGTAWSSGNLERRFALGVTLLK